MDKPLSFALMSIPLAFVVGLLLDEVTETSLASPPAPPPVFHDLRVNPVSQYVELIDPHHPDIVALAEKFPTFDAAYRFISTEIAFAPYAPPGPVEKTLAYRTGSCLGKAALLASIYRAMGMPSEDVRLVMGMVITPQGLAEHVWLDLEDRGTCLQQDPSGMLGQFGYDEFPDNRYVEKFVMKEAFCFNDRDFAVVSQLNRFRNGGMPTGQ
jgi:transglutaminase-like putative cysteine protease